MLSKREKVLIAVLGSLLLHLFILLLFGLSLHFKPDAPVAASNDPIELQIEPKEEEPQPTLPPTMAMAPTPAPPMVNNKESDEPPPTDPAFQSNANSKANSELPPTNSAPVPTQKGKDIPEFTFDTQNYTLGEKPAVNASAPAQARPPAQPPQPPDQPQPTPAPQPTPPPAKETPPPKPKNERPPKTEPTPVPTPEIKRELDEFAMLGPTPTPHPAQSFDDNQFDPTRREPMTEPPRPTPAVRRPPSLRPPSQPSAPGYQPQTQKAALSGSASISNKGPASVAALGTPMGRYQKAIFDAVGSRWYYYIDQRMDVASFGRVKIHFTVDKSGAILQPKVLSHSGNSTLEGTSLQAIMEATIPPMPPEVSSIIQGNQMELEVEFNLLDM
jgi:outer membrane biosynthesis protein TonB